jgi:hypothetical protein
VPGVFEAARGTEAEQQQRSTKGFETLLLTRETALCFPKTANTARLCMYVLMYVCMYACMHVCTYIYNPD